MDLAMVRDFRETLRHLERQVGLQLKDDTECCGVTLAQCHIIVEIGNAGETSVIDLATILGLDTSTLSRHINGMVKVGLVNRILNPKDRRYVSITLTEQGQKIYQSIEDICNSKYARVFEFIPREKHKQVLECFNLLVHAITEAKALEGDLRCCGNDPREKDREEVSHVR
ncbi:MAG TPA: MarR family transcriptional regulator [Deltaproteobacteria bacterium]|nr:MarR family transcriptional regulator [Deltaproteobacteria bacterium]